MSDSSSSGELVSKAELEEVAELFDRSEFAIDPTSADCRAADAEFSDKIELIYKRVRVSCPDLTLVCFRSKAKSLCRAFLRNKRN